MLKYKNLIKLISVKNTQPQLKVSTRFLSSNLNVDVKFNENIVRSPYGECVIPDISLPSFVLANALEYGEKPAIVSIIAIRVENLAKKNKNLREIIFVLCEIKTHVNVLLCLFSVFTKIIC